MVSQESPDWPRGILTQADREFLAGKRQLGSPQAECNARARIRERVRYAFYDMMYLWQCLKADDLRQIVQPERKDERIALRKAFQDTIALTVRALDHANDDKPLRIAAALIQAGTADQFIPNSQKEGLWDDSIDDTIPQEFVIDYSKKKASNSSKESESTNKTGIEDPHRIEWQGPQGPSPWDSSDPINDPSAALEGWIKDDYLNFGYVTHERLIQDRSISADAIAEAYNEAAENSVSPSRIKNIREAWDEVVLERPIFYYPMHRKGSSDSESIFDDIVMSPWGEYRTIGGSSEYF